MKVFYTDPFLIPLPAGHRFPLAKYRMVREGLEGTGLVAPEDLEIPPAATDTQLLRVHTPEYLQRLVNGGLKPREERALGLPWSPELVERSRRSVGGTLAACGAALDDGMAAYLGGGTHHAFPDRGEGFCVFNDAAVASRQLLADGRVRRVLVVDCDVHQGNGTAAIFAADPRVFTFSIHGQNNYPHRKVAGDLDIGLPDGTGDAAYLEALDQGLQQALDDARPDLAVYLAGADPYAGDALGRLSLTTPGLLARDRLVFDRCERHGLALAVTLGGGYAKPIEDTVAIYLQTVAEALSRHRGGGGVA